MSTYAKIFDRNQYNLKQVTKKSAGWFEREIREMKKKERLSAYYLMRGDLSRNRVNVIPGELYMFYYDAKHKDTLPYWDRFPLVFPFRLLPDGFIGLNMHYLPYHLRIGLLDQLTSFANNKNLDADTRLKFSWATLQGTSKLELAQPCVHRYLTTHVRSFYRKVDGDQWATAMMLPVQQFVKGNKRLSNM